MIKRHRRQQKKLYKLKPINKKGGFENWKGKNHKGKWK